MGSEPKSHGLHGAHLDIYGSLRKAKHIAKGTNPFRIRNRRNRQSSTASGQSTMQYSSSPERDEPDMEMSAGANLPIDRTDHSSRLPVHVEDHVEDHVETHMEEPKENKSEGPPSSDLLSVPIGEATAGSVSSAQEARGDTRSYISTNSTSAMLRTQTQNNPTELDRSSSQGSAKPPKQYTFGGQLRFIIFSSWLNLLLFAVPVGIALNFVNVNSIAVFVVNFLAIIPLAAMLSNATEEIALRTGETIGGLLNATFGNAVELIVSLIALFKDEYVIVQTSLIGSMLSNLLLVMGMCFFFGGICRVEQNFNVTVAQTASSMLSLAVGSLIIPTAFHEWSDAGNVGIAQISRGTSILLLIVYGCYLFFQLKTHIDMYNAPSPKSEKLKWNKVNQGDVSRTIAQAGSTIAFAGGRDGVRIAEDAEGEEDEAEEPQLQTWVAILTLVISTVLVALCAEFMVDSINDLTNTGHISETFVGLILLPIVGNAAEHVTAVTVAMKDKMDLAIGVAVGSSMQIALLVLPLIVVIGWIAGKDGMTLYFDGFQIAVLFVAMLLVNYLIQDGKSHWLEGVMLMMLYMIISISAWFYPSKEKMAKRLVPVPPLSQYQFGLQ